MDSLFNSFRIQLLLAVFIALILLAAKDPDPFQQVIDHSGNQSLKERLKAFEQQGIEKPVHLENYNKDSLISCAQRYLHIKHRMGGLTRSGVDCSGLVRLVYEKFGLHLPHSSYEQARFGKIVPRMEELKIGDLVFFYHTYGTRHLITHSGIFLGNGQFIHSSTSEGVIMTSLHDNSYWEKRFLFGTRLENDELN